MKILCRLLGHNYENEVCARCGKSLNFKHLIQYIAWSGPLSSSKNIERIKRDLLSHPDQDAVAWEIAGAIGRCNSGPTWDGTPIHPQSKAMLEEIGRALLAKAGLSALKVRIKDDQDPAS